MSAVQNAALKRCSSARGLRDRVKLGMTARDAMAVLHRAAFVFAMSKASRSSVVPGSQDFVVRAKEYGSDFGSRASGFRGHDSRERASILVLGHDENITGTPQQSSL